MTGLATCAIFLCATSAAAARPNILFILTDDQRIETLDVMPNTKQLFEDQGTYFPNAFATTPVCCPSRASILTGLYSHNHGVKDNNLASLLDHTLTMERYLKDEQYRTGIFGKFLNGWPIVQNPPYFEKWSLYNNGPYNNFRVNEQGTIKTIAQYATTYTAQKAVEFIEQAEQTDQRPWFLYVAPTAPHEPFTPETQYKNASVPPFVANPASFEADRSDKPPYVKQIITDPAKVQADRTAQLRMLMSVDDLVSQVFSSLGANNETQNTLAFFVSDNGYLWGEHGLTFKAHAYTQSVKVPMYMRWPGHVNAGAQDQRLVANIDLAPTVFDAVGVTPDTPQDGMSLLGGDVRDRILLERLSRRAGGPPTWAAIRTPTSQYTEYYGGSSVTYVEDSTPPPGPSLIATDPRSPANFNSPHVRGAAEAGATVRLYKAPTTSDCTPANLIATGALNEFVSPGFEISVPDDSTTRIRAIATDKARNVSPCSGSSIVYTEDSTAPPPPQLTDTDPDSPANDKSPTVKGTAQAGSTVQLFYAPTTAHCTPANLAATGTAAELASPGLQAPVPDDSTTRFRATATDAAGNTSGCSVNSRIYVEDSTPPPGPTLSATDPSSPANNNSPRVKGTAQAGSTVRIYNAATTADCTQANLVATGGAIAFGSPGLQISLPDDSTTRFRATATDAAGNVSPCSASSIVYVEDSSPPMPPQLTDTDPNSPANDNAPHIKGTAEPGSTVNLYKADTTSGCTADNLVGTGTPAELASPGFQVSVADNSATRFRATATDRAGNTSACSANLILYVEDSAAPPPPQLTGTDPASPANGNTPRVKGTAQAGATVRIYKADTTAGCTASALAATGTAAQLASPGLKVSVPDDSTTRFRGTATDSAGNTSACSTNSRLYVEDSTPPAPPQLTDTDPASPANNNLPLVKGTSQAATTVHVYKAPTTAGCTAPNLAVSGGAAALASPGLRVSVADDSSTRFRATATDAAGNTSTCSPGSVNYVEDSTAPAAPQLSGTNPSSPGNDNQPKVKGTAEAGSTISLFKAAAVADCTPANAAGTGTAAEFVSPGIQSAAVPDGSTTRFRAITTDRAGNASPCSTSSIVYVEDSTPPPQPQLTNTDPSSPNTENFPRIRGTAQGGTTVRLYKAETTADCTDPHLAATGTAAEFDNPGIQVTVADNTTTRFRATATDAATNASACSTSSIVYVEGSTGGQRASAAPSPVAFVLRALLAP
jgi:arylsulfatase A-like enzyme